MNIVMGVIGLLTWIILSVAMGTFAIVLTMRDGIIRRQAAISLMLAFYGIPALLWLFFKMGSSDFLGLGFGMLFVMLFVQVFIGYALGELIFKRRILRQLNKTE